MTGVKVSIFVDVSPVDAFEVFTDEIHLWWRSLPQNTFRAGRRGTMRFEPGEDGRLVETYADAKEPPFEVGRIRAWEPGRRLVFGFRGGNFVGEQTTEVEVLFTAETGGTRVTLEHRGWEAIPPEHPARHGLDEAAFWRMLGGWWSDLLRDVRRHVAAKTSTMETP